MQGVPDKKPSHEINIGKCYIGVYPDEQLFVVKGWKVDERGFGRKQFAGVLPFADVRGWGEFHDTGFMTNQQGIEFRTSSVDDPIIRVTMGTRPASVWYPRIARILENAGHKVR
jgi:hypothetical protein